MSFIDKAKNKASEFLSGKGSEAKTDGFLDKAEKFATDKLGADKADQVGKVRDAVDERIGDGDSTQGNPPNERSNDPVNPVNPAGAAAGSPADRENPLTRTNNEATPNPGDETNPAWPADGQK